MRRALAAAGRLDHFRCVTVVAFLALTGALAAQDLRAATPPLVGKLVGTADTLGRVTLTRNGKTFSRLEAGRYTVVIDDRAPHSGFILDRPNFSSLVVTSTPFVGRRTVTVTLTPGTWSFHGQVGLLHDFTVVA